MFVGTVTTSSIAAAVWSQATRNLTNPTGVWSDTTRTLTAFGTAMAINAAVNNTSLAASASVNLQEAAGKGDDGTIAVLAGAAGTCTIAFGDGTIFRVIYTAAAAGTAGGRIGVMNNGTQNMMAQIKNNDAANAASYLYQFRTMTP